MLVLAAGDLVLVGRSVDGDVERGAQRVGCTDREGGQEHCTEEDGFENVPHGVQGLSFALGLSGSK